MDQTRRIHTRWPIWLFALAATASSAFAQQQAAPLTFTLTFDPSITDSFTGRVYVMLSTGRQEPRFGPAWFNTQPFYAMEVRDWKAGQPVVIDDRADGFPGRPSALTEGEYSIQAVMRRNLDSPSIGTGEGTAYSAVARRAINGATSGNLGLHLDQVVKGQAFRETEQIKLVELRSTMLSDFHHRDVVMRAAVVLPKDYEEHPERRYPAMYWIGGFGSDHRAARFMMRAWEATGYGDQIVRVVLDPLCYGGHHVFADSPNNGPRGSALVQEFIPHIEQAFRLLPSPHARFLSGHSSGGWSSLWLQISYPDFFGGTWSIAPDPVDFRDFQRIDLTRPGVNMYLDEQGDRRPLARQGDEVMAQYDEFAKMEAVYGEGGQLRSFEWVFSPPKEDGTGLPQPLYDRESGMVNAEVADAWKRYDIRLTLEENWTELAPKLEDGRKLRVFMGDVDTFYLEGATKLLKQSQEHLGSKAVIDIEPGRDHGSIASPELRKRIDREMVAEFSAHHPEYAVPAPASLTP